MRTAVPTALPTLFQALLAALAALFVMASPHADAATVGSGRAATEARQVSGFDAVATSGSIDIVVRQGAREAAEVSADDNVLPLVETVVENGTLQVRFRNGTAVWTKTPVRVTVDAVKLRAVASAGSGKVTLQALKTPALRLSLSGKADAHLQQLTTDALDVHVAGSSDVVAAGSARRVSLQISGSGDAKLAELQADDVSVRIAGSGDADVTAARTLDVSIAGSGDVRYGGNPAVTTSLAGSGSVRRR